MYGAAEIEPSEEGEVPVKEVAQVAKRHVQVLATLEFKTTKLCAGAGKKQTSVVRTQGASELGPPMLRALASAKEVKGCEC